MWKKLLKNYGNYVFIFCEIGEIILFIVFLYNGIFPLLKNIKNMRKKIYFKTINKNPPKKNINFIVNDNSNFSNDFRTKYVRFTFKK